MSRFKLLLTWIKIIENQGPASGPTPSGKMVWCRMVAGVPSGSLLKSLTDLMLLASPNFLIHLSRTFVCRWSIEQIRSQTTTDCCMYTIISHKFPEQADKLTMSGKREVRQSGVGLRLLTWKICWKPSTELNVTLHCSDSPIFSHLQKAMVSNNHLKRLKCENRPEGFRSLTSDKFSNPAKFMSKVLLALLLVRCTWFQSAMTNKPAKC